MSTETDLYPPSRRLIKALRKAAYNDTGAEPSLSILDRAIDDIVDRIATLEKMDSEAATYVESVICMRTGFTGEPPYVGWEGLGLALDEALDERDRLRDKYC